MSTTVLKPIVIDLPDRGLCAIDYIDYFDEGRYGADNIHFVSRFDNLNDIAAQMDKCLALQSTEGSLIHVNRLHVPNKWIEPLQDQDEKYPQRAQYAIRFMLRIRFFGDFGYLDIGAKWDKKLTAAAAKILMNEDLTSGDEETLTNDDFFKILPDQLKVVNSCWLSYRDATEILNILKGEKGELVNAKNQALVSSPISYTGNEKYVQETNSMTTMSVAESEALNLTYLTDGESSITDGNGTLKA